MEELRRRLLEDLTDAIDGELRVDRAAVSMYSNDASLYEIEPIAVAFPRHTRDVERLAAYSADNGIPLIARGAGSGIAGGAIGPGIVVDFSRHMNQILRIDGDTVRVQPGVVRDPLNRALREHGRYFAPDPSNSRITTVGGMIGVDAAGSHAIRIGSTRDHVKSVECVLSGGQRLELGREPIRRDTESVPSVVDVSPSGTGGSFSVRSDVSRLSSLTPATRRADLLSRLDTLLQEFDDTIRQYQPPLLRNCCGYMLRGIRQGEMLDLPRLIVGSEGTLGIVTEATLYTLPIPQFRSAAMLMFPTLEHAVNAMQILLPLEPSACDLLDRRLLSLGRGTDLRFRDMILKDAEAGLIVEFPGSSETEIRDRLAASQRVLIDHGIEFQITREATTYEDVELLWALPSQVVSFLASLKGASRPLPFVEDVAVPPARLAEFLVAAQKVFQKHEVTATLYSHAASGQVHFRPILPVPSLGDETCLEAIARDLYRHVKDVGGTISGEHGDGLSRTAFIRTQYGPLYKAFQQLKDLFDPHRLMNPDKIISNDPQLTVRYLRKTRLPVADGVLPPVMQLAWTADEAADAAVRCNGCASCRVQVAPARMCPFVTSEPDEELTPRAKADLLRRSLCVDHATELLTDPQSARILQSCFNCKQCELDCPSEVNIPHLVLEARAQQVLVNGLPKTSWLLSRVHTYARVASRFSFLSNPLLRNSLFRKALQRFVGLAAERRLPRYARIPFLHSGRVRRDDNVANPGSPRPTIVYFVDYFANHHDTDLAEAFFRIAEHNGLRVYIPSAQTVSGMSMVSVGDMTAARAVAEQNIRELIEPAREGYPIVCTEPSAAVCLTKEYPLLVGSNDAAIVAQQTVDAGSFLMDLHRRGKLRRDLSPLKMRVAWHTPCHVKALQKGQPMLDLLRLIPGLEVSEIEKGCTGMAGTFGLAAENFRQSLDIGQPLIQTMKTIDAVAGVTDCSSCRMQMEQESSIPTIHPIKLLAIAYGLMPRLAEQLQSRPSGLSMS
ncbi:MAG: FAD-linked oxidase C-terminal domain-containing protein [Planctomycetota bacterium]